MATAAPPRAFEQAVLDFLAYLEFERGLSRNTLEAYRADLLQYGSYLREHSYDALTVGHAELAGFLTACALIKPSKSIHEVEAASVKKKLKDKAFARGVSREDVYKGAEELGVPLEEHIAFCIDALRAVAPQLGLNGVAAPAAS